MDRLVNSLAIEIRTQMVDKDVSREKKGEVRWAMESALNEREAGEGFLTNIVTAQPRGKVFEIIREGAIIGSYGANEVTDA